MQELKIEVKGIKKRLSSAVPDTVEDISKRSRPAVYK